MTVPLSLVLFDLDDVLCRYDRSARIAHIAAVVGRDAQTVRQVIWDSGLEGRADAGQVGDADYLDELGALLGYPLTLDDWLDAGLHGHRFVGIEALASELAYYRLL